MRKLRWRVILILVFVNLVSSVLSDLLTTPLVAEFVDTMQSWAVPLIKTALRSGMTLIIFTVFMVLGVREITEPVLRLARAANQIADGDYDVALPESHRRDEIGQLEKSFAVMVEELKSTEYMQKDFVSNVSHEYKTPLAVISGYAKLLQDESLPAEERAKYSGFIADEATRLSHMTSNILLLSKLEHQSVQPVYAAYSLDEQLRQAVLLYVPAYQDKDIALEIDADDITLRGNAELLMHVWTNILDNAVKFTPRAGSVCVQARIMGAQAVVCVADSGPGMDAQTQAHMFDQFYQGDSSRQAVGNGLGLSLARRIVQLHHGQIDVSSAPDMGTSLLVTLPLTR